MSGTEGHFRRTFGPQRAAVLLEVLQEAYDHGRNLFLQGGYSRQALVEPVVVQARVLDLMRDHFEPLNGVRLAVSDGLYLWSIDELYVLRYKKLWLPGYRPSNILTWQQRKLHGQEPLLDLPSINIVTGPAHSALTGLAEEFVVVKHHRTQDRSLRVEWRVDLRSLAGGQLGPTTLTLPGTPAPAAPAAISPKQVPATQDEQDQG